MADVVGTPPRPNPLAHPSLREDELCHVEDAERLGWSLCGYPIDESHCCDQGAAPCGRPACPECAMEAGA